MGMKANEEINNVCANCYFWGNARLGARGFAATTPATA